MLLELFTLLFSVFVYFVLREIRTSYPDVFNFRAKPNLDLNFSENDKNTSKAPSSSISSSLCSTPPQHSFLAASTSVHRDTSCVGSLSVSEPEPSNKNVSKASSFSDLLTLSSSVVEKATKDSRSPSLCSSSSISDSSEGEEKIDGDSSSNPQSWKDVMDSQYFARIEPCLLESSPETEPFPTIVLPDQES